MVNGEADGSSAFYHSGCYSKFTVMDRKANKQTKNPHRQIESGSLHHNSHEEDELYPFSEKGPQSTESDTNLLHLLLTFPSSLTDTGQKVINIGPDCSNAVMT